MARDIYMTRMTRKVRQLQHLVSLLADKPMITVEELLDELKKREEEQNG